MPIRQEINDVVALHVFLLVSVLYVISHLFERRSPVSHVCFEQTQPCLRHRSDPVGNPQHALCVWFSVRAQRTTRTRRAADFRQDRIGDVNRAVSVQNRRAKQDFYAQKDEK